MHILLWGLQSPINIGMVLRSAEVYHAPVTIFDVHGVFERPGALSTIGDFACGALQRHPPRMVVAPADPLGGLPGRRIATAISADAVPATGFCFRPDDVVVLGNEYDGLSEALIQSAEARVTIPMPAGYLPKPPSDCPIDPMRQAAPARDGRPNLNVAVAAAILLFAEYATSTR